MKTSRNTIRTYSKMAEFDTFIDRYRYLRLADGRVGEDTFGHLRYLNQIFYHSDEWKSIRKDVIIRDNGCDLAIEDRPIEDAYRNGKRSRNLIIHHVDPIAFQDILERSEYLLMPEYLVCCSRRTHNAIHYGDEDLLWSDGIPIRSANDTCPWKK